MAARLLRMPLRDRDAVIMAVAAVLFLHLLVIALLPREVSRVASVEMPKPERIRVTLLPPPEQREADYLRANPEVAPEAPPPDTVDYSNRDQVAAQEEVTPLAEDSLPAQVGDSPDSNRLVQGSPFQPPPTPAQASTSQQQASSPIPPQMPAPRENPMITPPEAMEAEPLDPDGLLALPEPLDNPEVPEEIERERELQPVNVTSPLDGQGDAANFTPPQQATPPSPAQREPMPRPTVAQRDNSFGPLLDRAMGVGRIGNVAFDVRYSEFGEYWYRVIEVIEKQWNNLVYNSLGALTFDRSVVRYEILIRHDGTIGEIRIIHSDGSRLEEILAQDAILSRTPFPKWTPDMIATMGRETTFTLGFIY
jgi:hypothetical protein